ncbi:hypothetical protein [Limosilactobacillus fermentum]|nr:hypothetical protein [Limosilactobacillus fermentum]
MANPNATTLLVVGTGS